ncbi:MAG: glutamine-hydrolyzing GMP synthase [Candidatus Wallbacteria bacterium]|nr:glutamine-hydrolyzing GMP synthase [Candidatus Wallbacteria bacterium]
MILIVDFGSQYTKLIARNIRKLRVYCLIITPDKILTAISEYKPEALIFSGGPSSVYNPDSPLLPKAVLEMGIPILGICYGQQLVSHLLGGRVERSEKREYGFAVLRGVKKDPILEGLSSGETVWMSHGDKVTSLPKGFEAIAETENCPYAVIRSRTRKIYGLQFHPEVVHTKNGVRILRNFLTASGISRDWKIGNFIRQKQDEICNTVKDGNVILAFSGGVDSSTMALFLHKTIPGQIFPIMVDTGLLREEDEKIPEIFRKEYGVKIKVADARNLFLSRLAGVTEPEEKRKIIGHTFIEVFEKEAKSVKNAKFLAQGTLYPDVIESAGGNKLAAKIKSHHNVGGLPERLSFKLIEPFRELFKDEVREVAKKIGLLPELIRRHPFPGPGLAVRVIGSVTEERLRILRAADGIFIQELKKSGNYDKVWQAFCVLLPIQSVGVMGDERTYESLLAIRSVNSQDGMTAEWSKLPHKFLGAVSTRIINEVKGINRVVYDISNKPPATIEWE